MKTVKEGTVVHVTQEGRFLKAFLEDGTDVSNSIDRELRRVASRDNKPLYFSNGIWSFAHSTSIVEAIKDTALELIEVDSDHQVVSEFIHKSPQLKPNHLIISDLKWKYLVRSAMRGKNIMMTGPAGTGKTVAAKYLVQALKRPDFYFNLGATQDPRATLIGNTHFSKETGTYFSESTFVKAIQTENAVILLDELSRAHPEAWNILMTVLDLNQRYLRLDEKEGSPIINVAPGVSFIATANIGNEYTSTRKIDRAIEDRFITIEMDQLDAELECKLLKLQFPNVNVQQLKSIAEIAATTRTECKAANPKLTNSISTRVSVEVASLIYDGFTLAEAAEVAIYPFFSEDGGIDSERTYVKQIVQKYCVNPESVGEAALFGESDVATTNNPF